MAGSIPASATDVRAVRPPPSVPARAILRPAEPWRGFMRRFGRNWIGVSGAVIVVLCLVVAMLAPLLAPYGPEETHPNWKLFAPNEFFLFGTDEFGRDIFSRVIFGARISLEVGLISVTLALTIGASAGLLAGFLGGWPDGL